MNAIPYSRLHPEELTDLEAKYGRELNEREALYLLRQERENGMRSQLFYHGTTQEPRRGVLIDPSRVNADQIVAASRNPWRLPLLILIALIVGEVWLAVHYMNVIESWFR